MGGDTAPGSRHVGSFGSFGLKNVRGAEFEKWPARPARRRIGRIGMDRFPTLCTGFIRFHPVSSGFDCFHVFLAANVPFGLSVMKVTRPHILYSAQKPVAKMHRLSQLRTPSVSQTRNGVGLRMNTDPDRSPQTINEKSTWGPMKHSQNCRFKPQSEGKTR